MMINKRLISLVPESKKHIKKNVTFQWLSLICSIIALFSIGSMLQLLVDQSLTIPYLIFTLITVLTCMIIRFIFTYFAHIESHHASKSVKKTLRTHIYQKLLKLGPSYHHQLSTSEVIQASVDGVDQLEIYFGSYLPQFFYSLLAPVTLFIVLSFVSFSSAIVLLICVPLIPISIIAIQKIAKKLLAKYWGQYTQLGDSFLENLQGLTTLKIYQTDGYKHDEMNKESEHFRKITMKVLTMQLNSITLMDLIAYGGASLGVIFSVSAFAKGEIRILGCFVIIMLSAEFFLPLRLLGSFFHVAMNGMSASDKIFSLLDLPEEPVKTSLHNAHPAIQLTDVHYAYERDRQILKDISMTFPKQSFTALVGESGCGKSTIAGILMGLNKNYSGSILLDTSELHDLSTITIMDTITYVGFSSHIFKGTVRSNLLMANPDASDETLWHILKRVALDAFLMSESGLDTPLLEKGSNFSGGQRQRLALARALLHDSPIYIFDEATSNIDIESENAIMSVIYELKHHKTVVLISHRLANVVSCDNIYVLKEGRVIESGTHDDLVDNGATYANLWHTQNDLENLSQEAI